ncbi:MAG TPA: IS701 family transposase [Pedomonas sp.]
MAASVETMLDLWSSTLREGKARLRPLFGHPSVAESAAAFLDSLVGPERRKTGWMRAEAAGDAGPWRQQAVLGRSHWDAGALRDVVREYVVETLGSPEAVLVIDETGFLKQGKASCGVARQYTGSAGKITNCQIGVFAAYVSNHGHALIDRQLYLPKDWAADKRRRAGVHVPEEVTFATKPALAVKMISRAAAASVPFSWVSGDSVYGVGEIEMLLRRLGKGYVLGVTGSHQIWSWNTGMSVSDTAADIAQRLEPSCWQRLSAGSGTKGERWYDWVHLELATLTAAEFGADVPGLWTRGLLIRRSLSDQNLAFFTTWSPAGTPVETLARVEGARWAIEDAFETNKTELGLDHNETRSWHGWHRHVSLVMLAFAMLAAVRRRANERPTGGRKKGAAQSRSSSAGRCRKSAASPPDWTKTGLNQALSSLGQPGDAPIRWQPEQPISDEGCNCNARAQTHKLG